MDSRNFELDPAHSQFHRFRELVQAFGNVPIVNTTVLVVDAIMKMAVLTAAAMLLIMHLQRDPPFRLVDYATPAGRPGDAVTFRAQVWRDLSRNCSVVMARSWYHSNGVRTDLPDKRQSHQDIDDQEKKTPGRMAPSVVIPVDANPDHPAFLVSTLFYECNQAHAWFGPVVVRTVMEARVLPP